MKNVIVALALGMLGSSSSLMVGEVEANYSSDPDAESGHYAFLGAKLFMQHKGGMYPVASVERGNLYLDTDYGMKKAKLNSSCRIESVVGISDGFLQVEGLQVDYSFTKQADLEMSLMRDAERMERDAQFAIQTGALSTSTDPDEETEGGYEGEFEDIDPYSDAGAALQDIDDYQEQVDQLVQEGELGAEGVFDTVGVNLKLTSNVDLEGAICAVVVKFVKDDAYSRFMNEQGSSVSIHLIEDLMGDIPGKISFRSVIGSGAYRQDTAEVEIHFFDKNGKPIASNKAGGLKMLTNHQLERLLASES